MLKPREIKKGFLKTFNSSKKMEQPYNLQIEDIMHLHQKSSTILLSLIIAFLSLFPIPGNGILFGPFLLLLAIGFLFSYTIPIPNKIMNLSFSHKVSKNILLGFFHLWRLITKYCKARYEVMSQPFTKIFWFFIWVTMCVLIILPIPFGNMLPSITLVTFFLGWILKDGLLLLVVPLLSAIAFIPLMISFGIVVAII